MERNVCVLLWDGNMTHSSPGKLRDHRTVSAAVGIVSIVSKTNALLALPVKPKDEGFKSFPHRVELYP